MFVELIEIVTPALIVFICLSALFARGLEGCERVAIFAFGFVSILHYFGMYKNGATGMWLHGSEAFIDLAVMFFIANLPDITRKVVNLSKLMIVAILINFVSYLAWRSYSPMIGFGIAFILFYCMFIYTIFKKTEKDGECNGWLGNFRARLWCAGFRRSDISGGQHAQRNRAQG